ncbi:MAG TPA: AtpZ/AtpI family protein, partial [Planctomycetota bacterium]|nr:AtpZ/AtpI family protein [Planctomycetota bacterium]
AVAVALFAGGGYWLDQRFGTGWIFTLLGLAIGFAGAFRLLYKEVYGDSAAGGNARAGRGAERNERSATGARPEEERSDDGDGAH